MPPLPKQNFKYILIEECTFNLGGVSLFTELFKEKKSFCNQ